MKKIIKLLTIVIFLLSTSSLYANQVDFYWNKDSSWDIWSSKNISNINTNLEKFYNKTWLNTDIVILWKWDECYLEANFDTCTQEKHNYSSDLIIVLAMKSDIKDRWDIRSLIKDEFKEVLSPKDLKDMQDLITYNFKNTDFTGWLTLYLSHIWDFISKRCIEVWLASSCDTVELAKQYHSFVAEKEYEKKYNAMMKIVYYVIFLIFFIISYILLRKFYIKQINNLFKDVKYKIITLWDYKIFENDKEVVLKSISSLSSELKNKLWNLSKNVFNLKSFYKTKKETFVLIEKNLSEMQESFSKKELLKEKVETMKKIDL